MIAPMLPIAGGWMRERWLVIGLLLFFAGIHLQYVAKMKHGDQGNRSAFLRWRTQLRELDDGTNVWEKYAYPNPPIMVLILQPFMRLPPMAGSLLWFWCKSILAIIAILAVLSMLESAACPFPVWGKLLAIALSLRPIEGDLVHGNVNLFILFLVVMSLAAFCQRQAYLGGALLALSIACKLTPALFILYFLWKRAGKTLLGTAVGLVVFVLLIPSISYGWDNNLRYLSSWHHQMIAPYAAGVVTSEHKNQSLPGLLYRMLTDEASFSDYEGEQKIVLDRHNLVSWDRATVQGIIIGSMGLFLLLALWRCRTDTEHRPGWQLVAEFSVILLGMLLFCERTWKHHCVTLLVPFSVMAYGLSSSTFSRCMRWHLGVILAVASVLMFATSTGHWDADVEAHARFGKLAQVYGAYVWVFLLLLSSMFAMLQKNTGEQTRAKAHALKVSILHLRFPEEPAPTLMLKKEPT